MLLIISLFFILFGFVGIGTEFQNYQMGKNGLEKLLQNLTLAMVFLGNGLILLRLNFTKNRFSFFSKAGILYIIGFFFLSCGVYGFLPAILSPMSKDTAMNLSLGFGLFFIGGIIAYIASKQKTSINKSWTEFLFRGKFNQCKGCGANNRMEAKECMYCGNPL